MSNHYDRMPDEARERDNVRTILLTGISLAVIAAYASFYPDPLMPAVFATLTTWAAMASALMAVLFSQRPFERRLNLWDKAIMLTFASLLAGAFVDQEAVRAFLEANMPAAAGAT